MVKRAVSTWSLHRTLGQFKSGDAPGNPLQTTPTQTPSGGLPLLDLPAELRANGYDTVQICHFHLPSRSETYLSELRAAIAASNIELDALLVDDGDLTDPVDADTSEAWIAGWLDVATQLGAKRARLSAGKSAPTLETIRESSQRLARLAANHPNVRVVTENWMGMMPNADTVISVLDQAGDGVGLLIDLGNWKGPDKYEELARIAPYAESCHAKCHFSENEPDREDFTRSLQILKDVNYGGPLALIYEGSDEWAGLNKECELVSQVFS